MSPPGARSNFMRQECLDSKFVFARPLPVSRLVGLVGSKLTRHGLLALRETLPQNKDKNNLSAKNVSIGIVGKDLDFIIYDNDEVAPFLEGIEEWIKSQIEEPEPPVGSMAEVPMEQALPTRALRAQRTRKENAS
ncbi:proteasome subunit alpha type-1-like isoform X2 [Heptranchias perlo]|uniref:proteasome subunit alpha type-1-like isoform X2 n=1 Tax=Heptranchias perlo TaxID=212740 RepID=UPI00355A2457